MSSTIWSGLDSGIIRYDLTYDASRPDPYGTQVNITFHLHVYRKSTSNYFGYQIRWDAMWCNGTNWYSGIVKENSPNTFDFWVDCGATVYTSGSSIGGVRLIMTSPNNSPSGWYDTGSDISISVPAMSVPKYWNDVNVYNPSGVQDYLSGYFDLYTSENNSWRYNLLNEDSDMTHTKGTWFQVQNIRPYYDYYTLDKVTGYDSIPATGAYRKTFDAADEVLGIYMKYKSYTMTIRRTTGIADITNPAWGWSSDNKYKTGTAVYGSSFRVNVSLSTGYHWVKWSGTFETTTKDYTFTVSNKNYDVTANAAANTYTVTYNGNDNTGGSTANSSHTYDTAKALTTNGFVKIGYTFNGWNTKADGTGTKYTDGQSVKNLTSTNGGTVTLYAQWSLRAPYNVFIDTYPKRDKINVSVGCTGANITGYKVYYRANSTGTYTTLDLKTNSSGIITGLQPNTNYQIYAGVTNAAGTGECGADVIKTKAYIPSSPTISTSNLDATTVDITVGATAETNAANTNYKIFHTAKITKEVYDMAIMSLSDKSVWARVFYHNCKEGATLFTTLAEIKSTQTADKYSRLGVLGNYKRSDGKYEFLLRYPNMSATQYNRWKQTNNPMEEFVTETSAGDGKAAGYTAVHIDWTGKYWGGLTRQLSNADTFPSNNCYLSGSVGHNNWFYAIGATTKWGEGIPAYTNDSIDCNWGSVELWVRIDDATVTTVDAGTTTKKTISGLSPETGYSTWMSVTNAGGTNYSKMITFTTLPDQAKIYAKSGDAWKTGKVWYKKNGEWIKVKKLYSKQGGEWKTR